MQQVTLFTPASWTVSEVNRYVSDLLASDHNLGDLWVRGEVSNLSRPRSGHLYFTLKDARAALRCVMWRNTVQRQRTLPQDGDLVEVHGSIGVYEVGGQYQLYADLIRPVGEGELYLEFQRLKAQLEAEGLFAEERKRPLPRWPRRIGVVTSPTGAALRDILNTLERRFPLAEVILAPTLVQGTGAPPAIIRALQTLNRVAAPDVILLARGGGSIEDLWAFNDEGVARAIVASDAPVITGVGHQTDFTIADFVADRRAPPPTAAAELATPHRDDLRLSLGEAERRLTELIQTQLNARRSQLEATRSHLRLRSPLGRVLSERQRLDSLTRRAARGAAHAIQLRRARLEAIKTQIASLHPENVLRRGYALISQPDGRRVRSVQAVQPGDALRLRLHDGELRTEVTETTAL